MGFPSAAGNLGRHYQATAPKKTFTVKVTQHYLVPRPEYYDTRVKLTRPPCAGMVIKADATAGKQVSADERRRGGLAAEDAANQANQADQAAAADAVTADALTQIQPPPII